MLALGIRYLTGYAVATDVSSRDLAEWPPHPARVFMAMAAAYFETGEDPGEHAALLWLELQESPLFSTSEADDRLMVTHYVPVNDNGAPIKGKKPLTSLQSVALGRDRQPRNFPRVRPHLDTVYLVWPESDPSEEAVDALDSLCGKVTRIGHSSSLVQMWIEDDPPPCNLEPMETGQERLRVVSPGTLDYLEQQHNGKAVERFAELASAINSSKGKAKREAQVLYEAEFGEKYKPSTSPPSSLRPVISTWQAYARVDDAGEKVETATGAFDHELLVFEMQEGPVVGLESTWALTSCLHKTILNICDPAPEWVSGHTPEGKPSKAPHLAVLPLAFVGAQHADGHLMGLGLAIPRHIGAEDWGKALGPLLYDENGELKQLELRAGSLGMWRLVQEVRPSPPLTLRSETWCRTSTHWATVTPIALDRHPKIERHKDREGWSIEVAEIVADSCERQGLPRPAAIDIDKTSWHLGAPRAVGGKSAGYPLMPAKEGQHPRQQVHAWIQFEEPVQGPLLLGAGRYRGYGVCRPWSRKHQ